MRGSDIPNDRHAGHNLIHEVHVCTGSLLQELSPQSHVEKRAELKWFIIRSSPQQTAQVAIRDLLEQLVGLWHKVESTSFPSMQKRLAPIANCLWVIHDFLQNGLKVGVDRRILSERMDQVERTLDRFTRVELCGYQRKDNRLLHLVAGSDRFLAGATLTMIANSNGSTMRPLAIGGLRAQSKRGNLPGNVGMITCLHGSRVESELHELFKFVSRDSIDSLDGIDREDDPSAFPRERSMESFYLALKTMMSRSKSTLDPGIARPSIFRASCPSGSSIQSPPPWKSLSLMTTLGVASLPESRWGFAS